MVNSPSVSPYDQNSVKVAITVHHNDNNKYSKNRYFNCEQYLE